MAQSVEWEGLSLAEVGLMPCSQVDLGRAGTGMKLNEDLRPEPESGNHSLQELSNGRWRVVIGQGVILVIIQHSVISGLLH